MLYLICSMCYTVFVSNGRGDGMNLRKISFGNFKCLYNIVSAEKRIKGSQNQGMQMETGKKRGKSVQEARECGIMKGAKNGVL